MGAGGVNALGFIIKQLKNPRLAIIDTLAKFRPAQNGKDNNIYDRDYEHIAKLKELADYFGISLLVIHHVRKSYAEDIVDSVSGTAGITGAADGWLIMEKTQTGATLHVDGRDVERKKQIGNHSERTKRKRCPLTLLT